MNPQIKRAGPKASSPEAVKPATGHTAATTAQFTDWRAEAVRVIGVLAGTGMPFHVDDLLMLVGFPANPKQLGALFAAASSSHLIETVGAAVAEDGRLVRTWVGVTT